MNANAFEDVLHQLRDHGAADAQLLQRFTAGRDEAAFAELVRRHGPLVLGVCRRVLSDLHAAEDAFQATFLLLARRANRLKRTGSLAGWLYVTAQRVAQQARRADERRRRRERQYVSSETRSSDDLAWREVRQLLDTELARLPDHYRTPLILCYLEGLSQADAARHLGWRPTVLRGRLERGRRALRRRLERHGFPLAAPLLLLAPPDSLSRGLTAATLATVRAGLTGGQVAPAVAALVAGATGLLGTAKLKLLVGLAVLLVVLGLGMAGGNPFLADPPSPDAQPPVAAAPEIPKPRLDRLGDPLPPHALMRLGTLRHRTAAAHQSFLQMLPSGQTLSFNPDKAEVRWMDTATGRVIDTWRLPEGLEPGGFSADGRLAVLTDRTTLSLWDLNTRRKVQTFQGKGDLGFNVDVLFSPDGKVIATNSGVNWAPGLVRAWDLATGRELWQEGIMGFGDRGLWPLGFLADSETLAVVDKFNNRVSLRDRATGRERRAFPTMPRKDSCCWYLTPDCKTLLIGTYGAAVRVWDVDTGKEREPLGGHTTQAYKVAIAADSKTILTGGSNPLMQVWDWPSGKLKWRIDIDNRETRTIQSLAVSPDGRLAQVVLWGEYTMHLFDLETGRERPLPGEGHRGQVLGVAITPEGKVVSAGTDNTIRVWDHRSGHQMHEYRTNLGLGASTLSLSADGRVLATADHNRGVILLHNPDTGRLLRTIDTGNEGVDKVAFAPEGPRLASIGLKERSPVVIQLWNTDTGREIRRLERPEYRHLAFSPDGRWLAGFGRNQVWLADVATGQVQQTLPFSKDGRGLAFSPNGRILACRDSQGISLLELASRKERQRIEVARGVFWGDQGALQFTPDSRWLFATGAQGSIHLWDLRSGRRVQALNGHDGVVTALALARDGRSLISASMDSTLVVWDVADVLGRRPDPSHAPSAAEVSAAWKELAAADAKTAFRAIQTLATAPGQILPLLREHLRPVPTVQAKEIERWIAALDSEHFAERQRAADALASHADQAEAALRRFLANQPNLEARRRAERVLDQLQGAITDPEQLRDLRALEVLEFIGTAEARDLLRTLAGGAPESKTTREAAAGLRRLDRSAKTDGP